eukprot:tig00000178_g12782.t1
MVNFEDTGEEPKEENPEEEGAGTRSRRMRKGLSFMLDPLDQPHQTWPTLTVREVNEFREIFDVVDCETPRGAIDKSEIQKLMGSLGLKPTEEELIKMIQEFRPEYKTGDECEISFEEFVQLMAKKAEPPVKPDEAEKAFQIFRSGKVPPGHVRTEDLIPALTQYPAEPMTEEQARQLLAQVRMRRHPRPHA